MICGAKLKSDFEMIDFTAATRVARLRLRPIREGDARDVGRLGGDEKVRIPANLCELERRGSAKKFVSIRLEAWADLSAFTFAILVGEEFVGSCTLHSFCSEMRSAEIGFWIGRPYWGRGIATRAVRRLVTYARQGSSLNRLTAKTRDANTRAESVLMKCGFQYRYSYHDMGLGNSVRIRCFDLELLFATGRSK